ncbi:MAG TPA: lysine 5,6-aminomutase subunit alpha [Polyangia bacterium]|nr:lysine 5,6-aminomutase subunit alpha [Polyangia bacterium]
MAELFVEAGKIARARELARTAAQGVQAFIDRHSTVSIERTVLRLLGISGAGSRGAPLANLIVDRLQKAGVLHLGAAYWLGRALRAAPGRDPLQAIERIAAHPEKLPALQPAEEEQLREEMRSEARAAVRELRARVEERKQRKARLQVGSFPGAPWKYVIVATGNIHDDVEQARAAAQQGADVIAVIRSTAQSLLDYVPHGATTEGFGGTYATQENFHIMREALDAESEKLRRYVHLTNYSSGLCMPEIAFMAAYERLDMLLNDAMYGILFRDINPRRTLCDQYFSRRVIARAGIIINTGEDNYLTTADAVDKAHTVMASQFINEAFARRAGLPDELMGLGHAFEIDKSIEDSFLMEIAQAQLVRQIFPRHPIKWMPATKHKSGDIFWSHRVDGLYDLVGVATEQSIELLGMMTESIHTPLLQDRFAALKGADYVFNAARHLSDEIIWNPNGRVVARAKQVLGEARDLLREVKGEGMFSAVARGAFADVKRPETGGRGLGGVVEKDGNYVNPILDALEGKA